MTVTGKSCCFTIAVVTDTGRLAVRAVVALAMGRVLAHHHAAAMSKIRVPVTSHCLMRHGEREVRGIIGGIVGWNIGGARDVAIEGLLLLCRKA